MSRSWVLILALLWLGGGCRLGYETIPNAETESGVRDSSGGVTATSRTGNRDTAAGRGTQGGSPASNTSAVGGDVSSGGSGTKPETNATYLGGATGIPTGGSPASGGANGGGSSASGSGASTTGGTRSIGGSSANTTNASGGTNVGSSSVSITGGTGGAGGGSANTSTVSTSGGSAGSSTTGVLTCRCTVGQGCVNNTCIPAKIVFTTSQTFGAMFGGISGADQICANAALSAKLPGQYRAWLSDSLTSPATRFARSTIPYALVNATVVATNWADLVDGTLAAPINLDENGAKALVVEVWTGTLVNGTRSAYTCNNWTSASPSAYGRQGVTDRVDSAWTDAYRQFCDRASIRLMCFQQ